MLIKGLGAGVGWLGEGFSTLGLFEQPGAAPAHVEARTRKLSNALKREDSFSFPRSRNLTESSSAVSWASNNLFKYLLVM